MALWDINVWDIKADQAVCDTFLTKFQGAPRTI